jgi:hypothetical protein
MGDVIERDARNGRYVRGKPGGPGRGGSPDRLCHDFVRDLGLDWERFGRAAISQARRDHPLSYLKLVARVVKPTRIEVAVDHAVRDAELGPVELATRSLAELRQRGGPAAERDNDDVAAAGGQR